MGICPGSVLGEVYKVERLIGQTSLASVYLAIDLHLERKVAVKVIAPEHVADTRVVTAFHREAVVMARVRHANVVQIYTFGRQRGLPFLVMEYMSGGTVAGLIRASRGRGECVAMHRVSGMLDQAAQGLEAVHRHGIVHGDVKPANMLIDARDSVTISDFGLVGALNASCAGGAPQGSRTGFVAGTPLYIAPEMILGIAVPSELYLCDVYSLGASVFEMLAGRGPFVGKTVESILKLHLFEPPPRISRLRPDLPPALDRVLGRALDKYPHRRYGSCAELASAFRQAVNGSSA